jgi:hypothetical protein
MEQCWYIETYIHNGQFLKVVFHFPAFFNPRRYLCSVNDNLSLNLEVNLAQMLVQVTTRSKRKWNYFSILKRLPSTKLIKDQDFRSVVTKRMELRKAANVYHPHNALTTIKSTNYHPWIQIIFHSITRK